MPFYPSGDPEGHRYFAETFFEHIIFDYSGISIDQQEELPYGVWLQLRFDAYVTKMNETKEGREYLDKAWLYSQTEPDRSGLAQLRSMMKGGR